MYQEKNLMYGKRNVLFNISFRLLKVSPNLAVLYWYSFLFCLIVYLFNIGLLIPGFKVKEINSLHDLYFILIDYSSIKYFLGDKFSLIFYFGIVPLSSWLWLKHVLLIHPNTVKNVAQINNLKSKKFIKDVSRSIDSIYIEIFGIFSGVLAVIILLYFQKFSSSWKSHNILLIVINSMMNFFLWYIIITFITKGIILIINNYFRINKDIRIYFAIIDDPFQLKSLFTDALSVLYFVLIGGFTVLFLKLFKSIIPCEVVNALLIIYFIITPIFLYKYFVIARMLRKRFDKAKSLLKQKLYILNSDENIDNSQSINSLILYDNLYKGLLKAKVIPSYIFQKSIAVYILQLIIALLETF